MREYRQTGRISWNLSTAEHSKLRDNKSLNFGGLLADGEPLNSELEMFFNPFDPNAYKRELEKAIRDAQNIAREINKIVDPNKNKAKKKWDEDVCTQFCQKVPGTQNRVDSRCPDHCMDKHPDWRRITSYGMKLA